MSEDDEAELSGLRFMIAFIAIFVGVVPLVLLCAAIAIGAPQ